VDQTGFLQHIGLVQAIHRGTAFGEEMNGALLDAREQEIVLPAR
jgi:hypothetical protein